MINNSQSNEKTSKIYTSLMGKQLPDWYKIEIVQRDNSKFVIFHSRIHVNKTHNVSFSYSNDYSDYEILNDNILNNLWVALYGN